MIDIRKYIFATGIDRHVVCTEDEFAEGLIRSYNTTIKTGYFWGIRLIPMAADTFPVNMH